MTPDHQVAHRAAYENDDCMPHIGNRRESDRASDQYLRDILTSQDLRLNIIEGKLTTLCAGVEKIAGHANFCLIDGDMKKHLAHHAVLESDFTTRGKWAKVWEDLIHKLVVWVVMGMAATIALIFGYGALVQLGKWNAKADEYQPKTEPRVEVAPQTRSSNRLDNGHFTR